MNERADVERLVRESSLFSDQPIHIRPLSGGITNRNFVASTDRGDYVVRIPGERTALLGIDNAIYNVLAGNDDGTAQAIVTRGMGLVIEGAGGISDAARKGRGDAGFQPKGEFADR